MKTPRCLKSLLISGVLLAFMPASILAQAGISSVPPPNVELRPVIQQDPVQPAPVTHEYSARWNERTQVRTVPLVNDTDTTWEVLGVQASAGVFIASFPEKVTPKKEETLTFVSYAADNTDGDLDVIRILTDHGIKEVHIKVVREEAVAFASRELSWTVGSAPETKSVLLTVAPGTATPAKVRATGGHVAVLEKVDATHWRVNK